MEGLLANFARVEMVVYPQHAIGVGSVNVSVTSTAPGPSSPVARGEPVGDGTQVNRKLELDLAEDDRLFK